MKRKATDSKKRLLRPQEALKRAHEEIEHFFSKCITNIFEKTEFKKEMGKLSKKIFQIAWDVAIKVVQVRSQLSFAHIEISSLGRYSLLRKHGTKLPLGRQNIRISYVKSKRKLLGLSSMQEVRS